MRRARCGSRPQSRETASAEAHPLPSRREAGYHDEEPPDPRTGRAPPCRDTKIPASKPTTLLPCFSPHQLGRRSPQSWNSDTFLLRSQLRKDLIEIRKRRLDTVRVVHTRFVQRRQPCNGN